VTWAWASTRAGCASHSSSGEEPLGGDGAFARVLAHVGAGGHCWLAWHTAARASLALPRASLRTDCTPCRHHPHAHSFNITYSLRPVGEVGTVFRRYPELWKVFVEDQQLPGR
jgi:hypothetical protein